jgi:hypothetical protein
MGDFLKDRTTQDIITQLNARFDSGALAEMVELQREFEIFSTRRSLRQSFALLGIVPADRLERLRWYKFLDFLKTYPSDLDKVNGHDRILRAYQGGLEGKKPMPVSIVCHSSKDDKRVMVSEGPPTVFSPETHVVISIPTTPAGTRGRKAAGAARTGRKATPKRSKT